MFRFLVCVIFGLVLCAESARADSPKTFVLGPDGKPVEVTKPGEKKPNGKEGENKSNEKENKEGEEGKDKKKDQEPPEPKVIRRGEVVDTNSNSDEFKARVGDDGKVAFQFRNQAWDDLIQWLSEIADQPLDWLELPGDRVNLATPGRYTVSETKDLFNRHLLARGYTILELEDGMTIAKTEKINPAMVPRVSVGELARLQPHTYVRTSLDVGWLSADKLAQELAAMLSSNGRLTAMTTTNRIEGMDAAANLRDVAKVLEQERDAGSLEALAPEFPLRYLPAEEAKQMLEQFLGVEKKSSTMTPQQMQMLAQQMRNQSRGAPAASAKPEISIVANVRRNSVFIRAPVDRIAVSMEFLKRIDLPSDSATSLADLQSRFQVYRLASLDPKELIEIITDMNVLEPSTRLRADKDNNALIVSGSGADQFIIKSLIERLDGSGRSFQVLQLRRLDANDVAESIAFLMGQKKDDEDSSSRSRYRYYGYYGYGDEEEKKETDEFRVAANARFRQVMLWANESEMKQVESLLIKLGEIPPPGGSSRTMRKIDAATTTETYEYLRRLQQQWQATSSSPLELPDQSLFSDPIKDAKKSSEDDESGDTDSTDSESEDDDKPSSKPDDENVTSRRGPDAKHVQFTVMQPPAQTVGNVAEDVPVKTSGAVDSARDFDRLFGKKPKPAEPKAEPSPQGAPIRIEVDSDGNLVLLSRDTAALDQLENLMLQFKPPRRPYTVFKIVHASAFWVKLNLEDFFEQEDDTKDSNADSFYRWYWDMDDEEDEGPSGLGKGNSLRFVDDIDTNTIVVSGATSEQLRTISELIELWDVAEPANKRKMRFTQLVQIKYGQADKIAETVKEAYRDLLSSNDKSFGGKGGGNQNNGGGSQKRNGAQRNREGNGSGLVDSENGKDGGGADFSFKGKLSMGVDMVGNTLLVSAEGEDLLELVSAMIEKLDKAAAQADEYEVLQVPGNLSGESIQEALRALGVKAQISNNQPRQTNQNSPATQRGKQ